MVEQKVVDLSLKDGGVAIRLSDELVERVRDCIDQEEKDAATFKEDSSSSSDEESRAEREESRAEREREVDRTRRAAMGQLERNLRTRTQTELGLAWHSRRTRMS